MIEKTSVRELIAFLQTLPEEAEAKCFGYDSDAADFEPMAVTISACDILRNDRGQIVEVLIR